MKSVISHNQNRRRQHMKNQRRTNGTSRQRLPESMPTGRSSHRKEMKASPADRMLVMEEFKAFSVTKTIIREMPINQPISRVLRIIPGRRKDRAANLAQANRVLSMGSPGLRKNVPTNQGKESTSVDSKLRLPPGAITLPPAYRPVQQPDPTDNQKVPPPQIDQLGM